jgi:protein involved in polysaccharide export with SLBB domain
MDPITGALVAALAVGVAGGVQEVGKQVIVDAYTALKAALKQKCGVESDVVEAVETLEKKPDSEARQALVEEEVAETDLAEDEELVQCAEDLVAAVQSHPESEQRLSKYNIQITNGEVGIIGDNAHVEGGIHFN